MTPNASADDFVEQIIQTGASFDTALNILGISPVYITPLPSFDIVDVIETLSQTTHNKIRLSSLLEEFGITHTPIQTITSSGLEQMSTKTSTAGVPGGVLDSMARDLSVNLSISELPTEPNGVNISFDSTPGITQPLDLPPPGIPGGEMITDLPPPGIPGGEMITDLPPPGIPGGEMITDLPGGEVITGGEEITDIPTPDISGGKAIITEIDKMASVVTLPTTTSLGHPVYRAI